MMLSRIFLFLTFSALFACSTSLNAPVEDIGQASKYKPSGLSQKKVNHIVEKGDTLFSIALRYDLDYKRMAVANNISPPYIIRPKDVIYLKEAPDVSETQKIQRTAVYPANNPIVAESVKKTGVISQKGVKQKPSETLQDVKKKTDVPLGDGLGVKPERGSGGIWIWPVAGKVVRQFSPQDALSKGIDISADLATPVVSSRSGEVVYAGSGLKGYGNLIIIRHDDTYISAYAHNKAIIVKEGQAVRQGEKIAEIGMSGTQFPKLHFEIREHGRPINPLMLLPKK